MINERSIFALLLFLTTLQVAGSRDSLLWIQLQQTGITYRQDHRDSALVQARRLLTVAEDTDDALAQAQLHSLIGFCLRDQGDQQSSAEELQKCIAIGEANGFKEKAATSKHDLYVTAMLPAYSLLSVYYKDKQIETSASYAKKGMEWIPLCRQPSLRVSSMSTLAEVLMEHKDYGLIYEPMKEAVADAIRQNLPDFAMTMTTYLIIIEHEAMHRTLADIPWIKIGEQLMAVCKTETAKSKFLSVTRLMLPQDNKKDLTDNIPSIKDTTGIKPTISSDTAKEDSIQTRIEYIRLRNEKIGIAGILLAVVIVAFIIYALWQRHAGKRKKQQAEQRMDERYIEGLENERNRLAKELHDGVSNQLLAIEMKLEQDGLTPQTMQLISESREQVRRVSHELIPPEFEHATLDEVVRGYAASLNGVRHCEVSYQSTPKNADWTQIPPTEAHEIYRIIQEVTSNAFKHAKATSVTIGLHLDDDQSITVTISDNGGSRVHDSDQNQATCPLDSSGIGMQTIGQRASAIGGHLDFFRHPFGTTVRLTVKPSRTAK